MITYTPPRILLSFKGINVYSWGVTGFLAFIVTGILVYSKVKKEKLNANEVFNLMLIVFFAGMIGARSLYAIENRLSILDFFAFIKGGLSWYGGLILGAFSLMAYLKLKKLPLRYIEIIALFLPIGLAIGRLGCFLNWDDYGLPTNLPWGIKVANDPPRHPSQIYEAVASLAIFSILFYIDKIYVDKIYVDKKQKKGKELNKLKLTKSFFLLYSIARFFLDFLRDSTRYAGLTLAQWISLGIILVLFILFAKEEGKNLKIKRCNKK